MTEPKVKNISSVPIDGYSNVRITSVWTFLQSVSLKRNVCFVLFQGVKRAKLHVYLLSELTVNVYKTGKASFSCLWDEQ